MLWLPKVVYENTDQKETTRLGEFGNGEWDTDVKVKREGKPLNAGLDVLDETETFEGEENSLVMIQTYTHTFQCNYQLSTYPFDTQVNEYYLHSFFSAELLHRHGSEVCGQRKRETRSWQSNNESGCQHGDLSSGQVELGEQKF